MNNEVQERERGGARSRPIRIVGFVDGDAIPASCYDRPYRLEPAKSDGEAYDVLREVMQRTRKIGVAAVTIRKRRTLAAVIPIGRTLVLNVLRFASGLMGREGQTKSRQPSAGPATRGTSTRPALTPVPGGRKAAAPTLAPRAAMRASAPRRDGAATPRRDAAHDGVVIDLAARRAGKRPEGPSPRGGRQRSPGVATLHALPRKRTTPVERQLA
jgi:hypothetical protein